MGAIHASMTADFKCWVVFRKFTTSFVVTIRFFTVKVYLMKNLHSSRRRKYYLRYSILKYYVGFWSRGEKKKTCKSLFHAFVSHFLKYKQNATLCSKFVLSITILLQFDYIAAASLFIKKNTIPISFLGEKKKVEIIKQLCMPSPHFPEQ